MVKSTVVVLFFLPTDLSKQDLGYSIFRYLKIRHIFFKTDKPTIGVDTGHPGTPGTHTVIQNQIALFCIRFDQILQKRNGLLRRVQSTFLHV